MNATGIITNRTIAGTFAFLIQTRSISDRGIEKERYPFMIILSSVFFISVQDLTLYELPSVVVRMKGVGTCKSFGFSIFDFSITKYWRRVSPMTESAVMFAAGFVLI